MLLLPTVFVVPTLLTICLNLFINVSKICLYLFEVVYFHFEVKYAELNILSCTKFVIPIFNY